MNTCKIFQDTLILNPEGTLFGYIYIMEHIMNMDTDDGTDNDAKEENIYAKQV